MTTASVQSKIKSAMRDSFITQSEAKAIVKEAEKGRVTVGEAQAVADLFDKGTMWMNPNLGVVPPGMNMTLAIPENPSDVTLEQGAQSVMEAFFAKNNIPAGPQKKEIKERALAAIENGVGAKLKSEPKLKGLFPLQLSNPLDVARDLPMQTAFVDMKKGTFFLKVEGGFVVDPSAKFYGPFALAEKAPASALSDQRIGEIRAAFNQANLAGTLNWQPRGVIEGHLGVRFERVELMRERHPDGYAYTAYVPVGALSPTAPKADPNTVREVYIERTGGLAGWTQSVGPLTI
jgi:hypothetical protein